jgi:multiple sugar transport system substrate-binding protein
MLEAARALTKDTDGDGRVDQWGLDPYPWWVFVWQNGGRILNEDRRACALEEPRAVEALAFWAGLRHRHGVTPTPEAAADLSVSQLFIAGRVAMSFQMYPIVATYRKTCSFKWDIAPVPSGPAGRATDAVGSAFAITRQSANKAAAFEFIAWLTSAAGMRRLLAVEAPSWKRLAQSPAFVKQPDQPKSKTVAVEAMDYARIPMQHPLYAEIMDQLTPVLMKAQRGQVSVREALAEAVPHVNRILQRQERE